MALHLVLPPPREKRRKTCALLQSKAMLECPRCNGREVIQTKIGVLLKEGKLSGGTGAIICAGCLMRGVRVVLA